MRTRKPSRSETRYSSLDGKVTGHHALEPQPKCGVAHSDRLDFDRWYSGSNTANRKINKN
jgi:hypothetical protein